MKLSCMIAILVTLSGVLFSVGCCDAGDKNARAKYGKSPHSNHGDCNLCHLVTAEKLRSWFVFGSTKRRLREGPVEVCRKCHGSEFGHATGRRTAVNTAKLPLAVDDTVTCAMTCHDMHINTEDSKQTFYHLRLPVDSLCTSCHDK